MGDTAAMYVLDAEKRVGEKFLLDFLLNLIYNFNERRDKMKIIKRFYDEDLRELVAEKLGVDVEKVMSVFTEECQGYRDYKPVFYIEVQEDA